jgi:hypothetical protein
MRSAIGPGGLVEEMFTFFQQTGTNETESGLIREILELIELTSKQKVACTAAAL